MNLAASFDPAMIDLLHRVAAQDYAAFNSLYEQTAPRLYGLALRVVGQRKAAEDVLQEAFLTIWRSADDYRASLSPPTAWLALIVRSRALDFLRRLDASGRRLTQELDENLAAALEGESPDPTAQAYASERANSIRTSFAQ